MSLDKEGKNAHAAKIFLIVQKFLHEAAKSTFCSLESPDYCQNKFLPACFRASVVLRYSCYVVLELNRPRRYLETFVFSQDWPGRRCHSPWCEAKSLIYICHFTIYRGTAVKFHSHMTVHVCLPLLRSTAAAQCTVVPSSYSTSSSMLARNQGKRKLLLICSRSSCLFHSLVG